MLSTGKAVARSLDIYDDYAVPGASPVLVAGAVKSIDPADGGIEIGSLRVDVNVAGGIGSYTVGSNVVLVGTQPISAGLVLGQQ